MEEELIYEEVNLDNEEFYSDFSMGELMENDEIDCAEEGFMRGYLE
jgi:hypothetical protein